MRFFLLVGGFSFPWMNMSEDGLPLTHRRSCPMARPTRILVVDDEPLMCQSLQFLLGQHQYHVETCLNGSDALSCIDKCPVDLLLLDISMPDMDGFQLLETILERQLDSPVIMMTGNASVESAVAALKIGAYDYLKKPFATEDLLKTIRNALAQKRLKEENRIVSQRLKLSERCYRFMVQNSPDMIYTLDSDGRFVFANEAFERLLGYAPTELIGKDYESVVHEADREKARWLFNERRTGDRAAAGVELRLALSKDSARFRECEINHLTIQLQSTGMYDSISEIGDEKRFLGTYGVARDVSDRRQLEAQLRQSQKMEALGTLAGGIAHDFNNLLMGIQGYASLALIDLDPVHPAAKKIASIEEHVQSGAELTRQLLGFARGGQINVKSTDIQYLVKKTADLFGRTKKEIVLHKSFKKEIWPAHVDEGQIKQVLLNLFVNAWQSMPDGGEIFIEADNVVISSDRAAEIGVSAGDFVQISVRDTGVGMDKDVQERIFEPFFTTKERGRGTGLGLATAYGIISGHGGAITVSSRKADGSTFFLYLPKSMQPIPEIKSPPAVVKNGRETVLIVDDEDAVIFVTTDMLKSLGYNVLAARSGTEAIDIFSRSSEKIDLLILDLIMPGMGGGVTYDLVKQINDNVKVLLSSGYSYRGEVERLMQKGCDGFIQKPYDIYQISSAVRKTLDRRASSQ
jgi:two-component system cell cycle sensor histidine kinase/response regulator CckA